MCSISQLRPFVILIAVSLGGCASPFSQYYQPIPANQAADLQSRRINPPPPIPELFRGGNPDRDIPDQLAQGYVAIGQSAFNGPNVQESDALKQGKAVGADRVIFFSKYSRTQQTNVPISTPMTQTSITNSTATAYGSGGSATAYGSSITNSYGTQTAIVPISIDRYDALAIYLIKVKYVFGARYRNLNPSEAKSAQSVNGVVITTVIPGSPAAAAGFLPGDFVLSANGETTADFQQLDSYLKAHQGQKISFGVLRDGTRHQMEAVLDRY